MNPNDPAAFHQTRDGAHPLQTHPGGQTDPLSPLRSIHPSSQDNQDGKDILKLRDAPMKWNTQDLPLRLSGDAVAAAAAGGLVAPWITIIDR